MANQRPRAESVLTRPSVLPSRASKFLHKVSQIRIRLPLSARKNSKDAEGDHRTNPYSDRSRSLEGFKPYMSHPVLTNMTVESRSGEGGDDSPTNECRRQSGDNMLHDVRPQDFRSSPVPDGKPPEIDGLPAVADTHSTTLLALSFAQPRTPEKHRLPQAPAIIVTDPTDLPSSQAPPLSNANNDKVSSGSGSTQLPAATSPTSKGANMSQARLLVRRLSRRRLRDEDTDQDSPPGNSDVLSSSTLTTTTVPARPTIMSFETSPASSRPTEAPYHNTFPLTRRETDPPPRLTLPNYSHRFSLTLSDGTSARFSPNIILHPSPLPLNLPSLPPLPSVSSSATSSEATHGHAGLRSIPELPQTGFIPDADDSDIGEDDDGDDLTDDQARVSGSMESSFEDLEAEASTSRVRLPTSSQSSLSSSHDGYFTPLPGPDTSRIDLGFINEVLPPSPSGDPKGKGKARQHEDDVDGMRTPTSTSPYRDYFNNKRFRLPGGQGHGVPGRSGYRVVSDGTAVRVPRHGEETSMAGGRPPLAPLSLSSRDSFASIRSRMSGRPGMHKRASRSMIDIHTLETRERVDQMIREEELEEEEKRRSGNCGRGKMVHSKRSTGHVPGSPTTPKPDDAGFGLALVDENEGEDVILGMASPALVPDGASSKFSKAPPYESLGHTLPLRRRRSMPMYTEATDPPPYPSFMRSPSSFDAGLGVLTSNSRVQPRDEEGREWLPDYSNDIYIRAVIPRKMEFVAAGVQARDRKWKKVLCVLDGTALKIYRPPGATGVSAIGDWWERRVGAADVTGSHAASALKMGSRTDLEVVQRGGKAEEGEGKREREEVRHEKRRERRRQEEAVSVPPPSPIVATTSSRFGLHLLKSSRSHGRSKSDVHQHPPPVARAPRPSLNIQGSGRADVLPARPLEPIAITNAMLTVSPSASSGPPNPKGAPASVEPQARDLLRTYTMQHGESGLGNDYTKRKNVIRVRVEGEQFLLQAKDAADVVAWIEALQASANISLDLDERPMPKGPLLPRRRRRRTRRPANTAVVVGSGGSGGGGGGEVHNNT